MEKEVDGEVRGATAGDMLGSPEQLQRVQELGPGRKGAQEVQRAEGEAG